MPKATVLKPFAFAADHIKTEDLAVGDVRDFPDDIVPGLVKGGYIDTLAADEGNADDTGAHEDGAGDSGGNAGGGDAGDAKPVKAPGKRGK